MSPRQAFQVIDRQRESDATVPQVGDQGLHDLYRPAFVLYVWSWEPLDNTKDGIAARDLKKGRYISEYTTIFVCTCVYQNVITRHYMVERAAQVMDIDVLIGIIPGDISFAVDVKADRFIDRLIELLDGLLVTGKPIVSFILPEGLIGAADK
jgi:hypothetical protein